MNTIIEACVIMHNMIVEIRMDECVYDGAGGLRDFTTEDYVRTFWEESTEETTYRQCFSVKTRVIQ